MRANVGVMKSSRKSKQSSRWMKKRIWSPSVSGARFQFDSYNYITGNVKKIKQQKGTMGKTFNLYEISYKKRNK